MNLIYFSYIFSGIITSLPVVVCRAYYNEEDRYDILNILKFLFIIIFLWTLISSLLYYYVYKHIKIGNFYVIIKLIEIGIAILTSIFIYKESYNIYNYFGMFFTVLSLFLVSAS